MPMGEPEGLVEGCRRIDDEDADHPMIGGWSSSALSVATSGEPGLERLACELTRPPVPPLREAFMLLPPPVIAAEAAALVGREGKALALALIDNWGRHIACDCGTVPEPGLAGLTEPALGTL